MVSKGSHWNFSQLVKTSWREAGRKRGLLEAWEPLSDPRDGNPQTSREGKGVEKPGRESDSYIVLGAWESHVHGEGGCIVA
ncbi:MAG: hypothetical protein JW902_19225 [Syntrophaceae bacterium]|nr:hypothetical protein [Syntrophaceae bacterium]